MCDEAAATWGGLAKAAAGKRGRGSTASTPRRPQPPDGAVVDCRSAGQGGGCADKGSINSPVLFARTMMPSAPRGELDLGDGREGEREAFPSRTIPGLMARLVWCHLTAWTGGGQLTLGLFGSAGYFKVGQQSDAWLPAGNRRVIRRVARRVLPSREPCSYNRA